MQSRTMAVTLRSSVYGDFAPEGQVELVRRVATMTVTVNEGRIVHARSHRAPRSMKTDLNTGSPLSESERGQRSGGKVILGKSPRKVKGGDSASLLVASPLYYFEKSVYDSPVVEEARILDKVDSDSLLW